MLCLPQNHKKMLWSMSYIMRDDPILSTSGQSASGSEAPRSDILVSDDEDDYGAQTTPKAKGKGKAKGQG